MNKMYQYVSCPTGRDKTLDLCYGSVKEVYKSLPLSPLGPGDHNCVHLLPTYRTVLKREKVQTKDIKDWTEESVLCLHECFDCTDWDMLKEACGDDLDELADVTCSYATFCRDMIIPCKRVKVYPNNKPWITKSSLQTRNLAFKHGAASELHTAIKELKTEILKAKQLYIEVGEQDGYKAVRGLRNSKNSSTVTLDGFDSDFHSVKIKSIKPSIKVIKRICKEIQEVSHKLKDNQHFYIEQKDVEKAFCSLRINKT